MQEENVFSKYLSKFGYSHNGVDISDLKVGEYTTIRLIKTYQYNIIISSHYGIIVYKVNLDHSKCEDFTDPVRCRAIDNKYPQRMFAYGCMWTENDIVKSDLKAYHEPHDTIDLPPFPIAQKLTNTHQWLKDLRQNFWKGQSYSHIDETLQRLLFAKFYAENNGLPFHVNNFVYLYKLARDEYYANTTVNMGELPSSITKNPLSYRSTIEIIQSVNISEDTSIWHIINHLWTEKSLQKEDGQYFTPFAIKKFMIDIYPPSKDDKICDPCGGSGGFIIMAADSLDEFRPQNFYYYDLDGDKIAQVAYKAFSTYRHKTGKDLLDINRSVHNSLDNTWDCSMDRIYTNVPFGNKVNDHNILRQFDVGRNKSSELSQLLFIEKCLSQLEDGGTFATVVDKGIVTNLKYTNDRAMLANKAALELVVELPSVAFEHFAGTTFPTFLLFFRKTEPTYTRYEKVQNIGYDANGFNIRAENTGSFDSSLEHINYKKSDLQQIVDKWVNKRRCSGHDYDYETTLTGNWLWGHWKYSSVSSQRIRDIAHLVIDSWDGENMRNPTVDRKFRYVKETHLCPKAKSKTRTLKEGCILMSRLLSEGQSPSCGIIHELYDGAGCTNENYIISVKSVEWTNTLWYLINFDIACHEYLWSHCRGQGRGRITENDLLGMPVRQLTDEEKTKCDYIIDFLGKKVRIDNHLERKFLEL